MNFARTAAGGCAVVILALASQLALSTAPVSAASADDSTGPFPTTVTFVDPSQLSQNVTDYAPGYLSAQLKWIDKGKAKPTEGNGACTNDDIGPIMYHFAPSTGGAETVVKGCIDQGGIASVSIPAALRATPVGTKFTVTATFLPCSGCNYMTSTTTTSATLTIATTTVVPTASIDYSAKTPTTARLIGILVSPSGDLDLPKPAGTWSMKLTASDGSGTIALSPIAVSAGDYPQWKAVGLVAGTSYTATPSFTIAPAAATHHSVEPRKPASFTTTGSAPTPPPTADPVVTPVATATPDPAATGSVGAAPTASPDAAASAATNASATTPILYFVIGVVALLLIAGIVTLIVYRRRAARAP